MLQTRNNRKDFVTVQLDEIIPKEQLFIGNNNESTTNSHTKSSSE